jgi:hypothetical protein
LKKKNWDSAQGAFESHSQQESLILAFVFEYVIGTSELIGALTMDNEYRRARVDLIVLVLYLVVLILMLSSLLTGIVWIELDIPQMGLWINSLLSLEIAVIGVVFTYSFVRYTQDHQYRHLALIMIALNAMLLCLFYLLTNVAAIDWSPFAGRERNRTIVTVFAFIMGPPLLFGSLTEDAPVSKRQRNISLIYGGLVTPSLSTWFLLSHEPVFITSLPGGGFAGITPIAWIILAFIGVTMTAALIRSIQAWRGKHDRIDLSIVMALTLWILSTILFSIQRSPYQIMELVWVSGFIYGFLVIAVAMIITAVIEPHKALVGLVEEKTDEVEASRKESEFYLNLWGHKIGNLLQGLVIYLDLLSLPEPQDPQSLQKSAKGLSREAALINRQVGVLAQVKEKSELDLQPLNAHDAIQGAVKSIEDFTSPETLSLRFHDDADHNWVLADDLLKTVFENLLSFIIRSSKDKASQIDIRFEETKDWVGIHFTYSGDPLSEDAEASVFQELHLFKTTLNLGLYSVKILMDHYEGVFEYHRLQEPDLNRFVLRFKSAH